MSSREFSGFDHENFTRELDEVFRSLRQSAGEEDIRHLRKIELWGRLCTFFGLATAWIFPNPISAFLISQGKLTRWAIVNHHVAHRGYDLVPGIPKRYTSKVFAKGWRRFVDWFDWMLPSAWNEEHNLLHHYSLGEERDPDKVEKNLDWLRESRLPIWLRYGVVAFLSATWKIIYYAPNTLLSVKINACKTPEEKEAYEKAYPWQSFMTVLLPTVRHCYVPYAVFNFIILPSLFCFISFQAAVFVLINMILAEIITNIHSFLVITPNHAGDDLYQFDRPIKNKNEFYFRQTLGSVNYRCGSDLNDFLHGWLNYQIEHHLRPDMTLLQYKKAHPQVKMICEKYGIPFCQESILSRVIKTLRIMVGTASMKNLQVE